jgi:hypothetical protein
MEAPKGLRVAGLLLWLGHHLRIQGGETLQVWQAEPLLPDCTGSVVNAATSSHALTCL